MLALRSAAALLVLGGVLAPATGRGQASPRYDLVLANGTIVDGTGATRQQGDIAIVGDRIVRISAAPIPRESATRVLDVRGLVVAPGFIDIHAHAGTAIATDRFAENFLRQGITTTIASLHSQDEPWPLAPYASALRSAPNVGFFAGHTWIRKRVMGLANRPPSPDELAHMVALVDSSMQQGALGLATGLEYVPATYATTDEVIALARPAARYGGIYITHMRDEGPRTLASWGEVIRIAREAGIPAQVNHHKVTGAAQFGWSTRTIALLDSARAAGLDVSHDVYPYTAFALYSDLLIPAWALAGGTDSLRARLADRATRARIEREMLAIFPEQAGAGLASVQFSTIESQPQFAGKTLADFVRARGLAPTLANGARAVLELQLAGGFLAIYHSMDERDVERILQHPLAMIESDGDVVGLGMGFPHPRSYGAFPRVLARYVRERGTLTLEQAIHKMTQLPAQRLGIEDRGVLREGMAADLVAFDPARIRDVATYTDPHHYSVGVVHLLVNGVPVLERGSLTGALPGRAVLGRARLASPPALR